MTAELQSIKDYFGYSKAYLKACHLLHPEVSWGKYPNAQDLWARTFRNGPLLNNLGLACELSFKTALKIKKRAVQKTHDLVELFEDVKNVRDTMNVRAKAKEAAILVDPPEGILQRIEGSGQSPLKWFEWETQLSTLNDNYSKFRTPEGDGPYDGDKFRSRYPPIKRNYREVCVEAIIAALEQLLAELEEEILTLEHNK